MSASSYVAMDICPGCSLADYHIPRRAEAEKAETMPKKKNPAAVALVRKGGKARKKALSAEEQSKDGRQSRKDGRNQRPEKDGMD